MNWMICSSHILLLTNIRLASTCKESNFSSLLLFLVSFWSLSSCIELRLLIVMCESLLTKMLSNFQFLWVLEIIERVKFYFRWLISYLMREYCLVVIYFNLKTWNEKLIIIITYFKCRF